MGAKFLQGKANVTLGLGIQTSVPVGEHTFTVETETRAADQPLIDTTVYAQGRVMYRRVKSYQDLLGATGGEAEVEALRERIGAQHRGVIDDLRSGALRFDLPVSQGLAAMPATRGTIEFPAGIEVRLLNASSWLAAGRASLEIEVRGRATLLPAVGISVDVSFEGVDPPMRLQAGTDPRGRVALTFPLPKLGPDGGQLIIRAAGPAGQDELRYRLKPKARQPDSSRAQTK